MAKTPTAAPSDGVAPVVQALEDAASAAVFEAQQLVPGIRDFLVEQFRNRPKPWSAMLEEEQRDLYAAAEHVASELVRKAVETVVASGRSDPIRALLTKFTHTDKIVLTAEVKSYDEDETIAAVLGLHKARGKHIMIFVASADDYRGDLGPEIEPDEPGLDFEHGGHPDDDSDLAGDGGA